MRRLLALPLLFAAPVAAQTMPYARFAASTDPLPRVSGEGFGTATSTPLRHVTTGNPAALPDAPGVALGGHTAAARVSSYTVPSQQAGLLDLRDVHRVAATQAPAEAAVGWTHGRARLGVGYGRTLDEQHRHFALQADSRSRNTEAMHHLALAVAVPLAVPGVGTLTPGGRVGGVRYAEEQRWERGPDFSTTRVAMHGAAWAAGAVLAPDAVPVRVGVFYESAVRFEGTAESWCEVPLGVCASSDGRAPADTEQPARLEASASGTAGAFSADATVAGVFWNRLSQNRDVTRNTVEGHVNVRYAVRPGLALTAGVAQRGGFPLRPAFASTSRYYLDRLVLAGATYTRGAVVLDAAYVNGGLLARNRSALHLGSLGVGYRF